MATGAPTTPSAEPGLDELAGMLEARIVRLSRLLIRRSGGPSRTQLSVLATLRDCGPRRITELADAERITQPSMTVLVSRLEEQGWARRAPDPSDRRAVTVTITAPGLDVLARLSAARAAVLAERLQVLEPSQRQAIAAALPALDRLIDD